MKKVGGFTLIELMITVAVVAILAAVALPSYRSYIVRSNRAAAVSFLMDLASKQEQYNLDARRYADQLSLLGAATVPPEIAANYSVVLVAANPAAAPPSYSITATPINGQTADTQCAQLSVDQTGTKMVTGTNPVNKCW